MVIGGRCLAVLFHLFSRRVSANQMPTAHRSWSTSQESQQQHEIDVLKNMRAVMAEYLSGMGGIGKVYRGQILFPYISRELMLKLKIPPCEGIHRGLPDLVYNGEYLNDNHTVDCHILWDSTLVRIPIFGLARCGATKMMTKSDVLKNMRAVIAEYQSPRQDYYESFRLNYESVIGNDLLTRLHSEILIDSVGWQLKRKWIQNGIGGCGKAYRGQILFPYTSRELMLKLKIPPSEGIHRGLPDLVYNGEYLNDNHTVDCHILWDSTLVMILIFGLAGCGKDDDKE